MVLFPTSLATWSLGTTLDPVGCLLQTMPTCSAVSGPWPKRVSMMEGDEEQVGEGEEKESDGLPLSPQYTAPSAVSWLPSLLNGTN